MSLAHRIATQSPVTWLTQECLARRDGHLLIICPKRCCQEPSLMRMQTKSAYTLLMCGCVTSMSGLRAPQRGTRRFAISVEG
eukprot:1835067-Amphidinium_carterae.2